MTDLERFFRRLVQTLSAGDPARLREPIPINEIRGSILPYRTNRRTLGIDSSEDYELVLMRFCAGEGAFAHTSPDEARLRFEREVASPNPDLTALRHFKDAAVSLSPHRVASAMAADADTPHPLIDAPLESSERSIPPSPPEKVAPPDADIALTMPWPASAAPDATPTATPRTDTVEPAPPPATRCVACDQALPDGRPVKFCPYCGKSQLPARCSTCGTELEPGWKFCPSCGQGA